MDNCDLRDINRMDRMDRMGDARGITLECVIRDQNKRRSSSTVVYVIGLSLVPGEH